MTSLLVLGALGPALLGLELLRRRDVPPAVDLSGNPIPVPAPDDPRWVLEQEETDHHYARWALWLETGQGVVVYAYRAMYLRPAGKDRDGERVGKVSRRFRRELRRAVEARSRAAKTGRYLAALGEP